MVACLPPTRRPIHAERNCRLVRWGDRVFTFDSPQSRVVSLLMRCRRKGNRWASENLCLDAARSSAAMLFDLFRGHPAWGAMIVSASFPIDRTEPAPFIPAFGIQEPRPFRATHPKESLRCV